MNTALLLHLSVFVLEIQDGD